MRTDCVCPPNDPCPDPKLLCPKFGKFSAVENQFALSPSQGIHANVVVDCDRCLTDEQLQAIADDLDANGTAFLLGTTTVGGAYDIRAFEPGFGEVPFGSAEALSAAAFIAKFLLCAGCRNQTITIHFVTSDISTDVALDNQCVPFLDVGPTTLDTILTGANRAALLACFGLTEADIVPGLPIQVVTTFEGIPTVIIPLRSRSKLNGFNANDPAFIQCQQDVAVMAGIGIPTPGGPVIFYQPYVLDAGTTTLESRTFGGTFTLVTGDPAFNEQLVSGFGDISLGAYAIHYGVAPGTGLTIIKGKSGSRRATIYIRGTVFDPTTVDVVIGSPTVVTSTSTLAVACGSPPPSGPSILDRPSVATPTTEDPIAKLRQTLARW